MAIDYRDQVQQLSTEKALAVAAYGESVAAYRYRTLVEKSVSDQHREIFTEMANEEHEHHDQVQALLRDRYPDSDFVLADDDKALVIAGPRMLEVHDAKSFARAVELIRDSELRTGRFYAMLQELTHETDLKAFLKEMADECIDHAARLDGISLST